ncbi:hypothetical protein MKC69_16870 [[Clostridium] innocuum]|nr:hypothetical protein [[Clostridium] innocuum]
MTNEQINALNEKYRKSKDYKPATREQRIKWINRMMLELSDSDLKELYDISLQMQMKGWRV